jgi:large subunit ribosomal protein L46
MASHFPPPATAPKIAGPYVVKSGILLSRPPLLTRPLTSFEKAFFFYQKRLNERLVLPFTRYFYFKKDTPADNDWKQKIRERNGNPAKELGGYQPYGKFGWNDEVLVGDKISEPQTMVESLVRDAVMVVDEYGGSKRIQLTEEDIKAKMEMPLRVFTDSDKKGDYKRLDRKLGRTLYLCVRKGAGWGFPNGPLMGRENLSQVCSTVTSYYGRH